MYSKEIVVSKLCEFSINQLWLVVEGKSAFDQRPKDFILSPSELSDKRSVQAELKFKYTLGKRVYMKLTTLACAAGHSSPWLYRLS